MGKEKESLELIQEELEKVEKAEERKARRDAAAKKLKTAGKLVWEAARVLLPTAGSFAGSYLGTKSGFAGQSVPVDAVVPETTPPPAPVPPQHQG